MTKQGSAGLSFITNADRIAGCILGGAIGDALGIPYEFQTSHQIGSRLIEYQAVDRTVFGRRELFPSGGFSDDTDMSNSILDAYLTVFGENPDSDSQWDFPIQFAHNCVQWLNTTPNGMGGTIRSVISQPGFVADPQGTAASVWLTNPPRIPTNGAVMRTAVIGCLRPWDLEWTAKTAAQIARCTHPHHFCVASCVAVSVAVASLISSQEVGGLERVKEAIQHAYHHASKYGDIQIGTAHQQRIVLGELHLQEGLGAVKGSPVNVGHTLKCLGAGFWALDGTMGNDSFFDTLCRVIQEGGDTDTNACVAGSLMGACLGTGDIPSLLISGLDQEQVMRTRIDQLIDIHRRQGH